MSSFEKYLFKFFVNLKTRLFVFLLLSCPVSNIFWILNSYQIYLLISWLQSPSAVILEPRKIKSATVSTVSPSICHEVMGLDAMISVHLFLSSFNRCLFCTWECFRPSLRLHSLLSFEIACLMKSVRISLSV